MSRRAVTAACLLLASCASPAEPPRPASPLATRNYDVVELRLRPLATPMGEPQPGDWLLSHPEGGQTFAEYLEAEPVRKSQKLTTIYILLLGDFTPEQRKVLATTQEYLRLFYQSPVKVLREMPLADVPARARRKHPTWGMEQIQTGYILNEVLLKGRPADALAYLCFTSLGDRTGVWSIYRKGDPAESEEIFAQCLRRAMHTASHETGHILGIVHCTAFECNMNGSNSLSESDRRPMHFCPVCLRKVFWNLQADPDAYLAALEKFCRDHELADEAKWYAAAREQLAP